MDDLDIQIKALKRQKRINQFWARMDQSGGAEDCWPWIVRGDEKSSTYGSFLLEGKNWAASRLAYTLTVGPIPDAHDILHSCDNPPCCNPAHLRAGTPLENMRDAISRGRLFWRGRKDGTYNGRCKLNEEKIREIKRRAATGERRDLLAKEFGIAKTQLYRILRGDQWSHVT